MPRTAHIEFEHWTAARLDRVFLFFTNPGNLPRIMPASSGTELVRVKIVPPPGIELKPATVTDQEPVAGVGSEIVTSFRIVPFLPFRAEWTARITEFEWNHHFADVQQKGPFKSFHHRHEFVAEVRDGVAGTKVQDVIDYDPGYGFLGTVARKLFIEPLLRQTFLYRQQALARLLG